MEGREGKQQHEIQGRAERTNLGLVFDGIIKSKSLQTATSKWAKHMK